MHSLNSISLCMIVKNEASCLENALSSVSLAVQELIVVDTGSFDETIAIASRHGAKIYSYAWDNDFSAARNFSIALATQPWILVMDADESLSPTGLEKLGDLVERAASVAYSLTQRNYLSTSERLSWDQSRMQNLHEYDVGREFSGYLDMPVVRLFPRRPGIRFSGRIHESVEESLIDAGISIENSGLVLRHYGQLRNPQHMKQKRNLYLRLGLEKLEQAPLNPSAHFELGIQYSELGYFADAIPHFEKAIEHGIDSGLAELHLGICCSRLERFAEARQHLLRSRETRPDSAELYCELGLISLWEGLLEDAKLGFEKALAITPHHVGSLSCLGSILMNQEKWTEGMRLLKQAVELDPNHQDSWVNLGLAYQSAGKFSEAIECQRRVYSLKPDNPELAKQLGLGLARSGKYSEAAEVLGHFIRREPADDALKLIWAMTLVRSGQKSQALRVYEDVSHSGGELARIAQEQINKLGGKQSTSEDQLPPVNSVRGNTRSST